MAVSSVPEQHCSFDLHVQLALHPHTVSAAQLHPTINAAPHAVLEPAMQQQQQQKQPKSAAVIDSSSMLRNWGRRGGEGSGEGCSLGVDHNTLAV